MSTPALVILQVDSFGEAREIFERLGRCETYPVGRGGMLEIFPDDVESWFDSLGFVLTYGEFFRRFVGANQPQPQREKAVSLTKTVQRVAHAVGLADDPDDPHRLEREKLASRADVDEALAAFNIAQKNLDAAQAVVNSGDKTVKYRERFNDAWRAASIRLQQVRESFAKRANLCPPAVLQSRQKFAKRRAQLASSIGKMKADLAAGEAAGGELSRAQAAVEAAKRNGTGGPQLADELRAAERRLRNVMYQRDETREAIAEKETELADVLRKYDAIVAEQLTY